MAKPHRSSWLTTAQGKEGTDVGEGFRVTPIFLQSCPIFPGREGEHTWPHAVVTEMSAAKNRPVCWRASFPDGQLSWEQLKKSNLHSGFQKYLIKMWCGVYRHRRLLSLTEEADHRQKQKLGRHHWFGQFTVHLTRKILPYLAPSLSASPAWTDSNPAISFESSAFCPPFLPISLIRSLTCSLHSVAFMPLPLLPHFWHPYCGRYAWLERLWRGFLASWCSSPCFWRIDTKSTFSPFFSKSLQWLPTTFRMKIPRFTFGA